MSTSKDVFSWFLSEFLPKVGAVKLGTISIKSFSAWNSIQLGSILMHKSCTEALNQFLWLKSCKFSFSVLKGLFLFFCFALFCISQSEHSLSTGDCSLVEKLEIQGVRLSDKQRKKFRHCLFSNYRVWELSAQAGWATPVSFRVFFRLKFLAGPHVLPADQFGFLRTKKEVYWHFGEFSLKIGL